MKEKPLCRTCSYRSKPMIHRQYPNARPEFYCTHPDIKRCAEEYTKKTRKRIVKSVDFLGFKAPPKTSLRWCPLKGQMIAKEEDNE